MARTYFSALMVVLVGCAHALHLRPSEFAAEERDDVASLEATLQANPSDAAVLYQVAATLVRAGKVDEALYALGRMAELGTGIDPRPKDGFAAISSNAEYQRIVASIRAQNPPVARARELFSLDEGDLVPEGIAWSEATQRFYLGSVKRKIIAVDRQGRVEPFVAEATGGLAIVLGLRVDDARGELWAASGRFGDEPAGGVIGLMCFRLSDGALLRTYATGQSADDMVNDIAVAADGTVFATLTRTGQLIRIDPATQVVSRLLPKGAIPDANGITVSGAALFVSSWRDIYRVDLPSLRVRPLPKPSSVVSGCFDGLYSVGDELVGIQNCVHATGRAMVLHLDDEGERIERARVLESYNPLFDTVTTAAVVGDELVFVANVQFRKMGKPANAFDRLRIVSVKIR